MVCVVQLSRPPWCQIRSKKPPHPTFQDSPKLATADRGVVTVSSVTVATTALENENYITKDKTLSANATERITSLVIGPGERLIIESATQNNVFNLIGFEDSTTSFPVRTFGAA